MKGHNPMLYKARLWNPVSKSKYSYTPIPEGEGETTVKNEASFDGRYQLSRNSR